MTSFKTAFTTSLAVAALLGATGCGKERANSAETASTVTFPGGASDGTTSVTVQDARWCVKCHGDAAKLGADAAPGYAFAPTTGAHQTHLLAYVQCGDCHVVPATGATHTTGPVVDLKYVATRRHPVGAPDAAFDAGTCSATYCHGNWTNGNGAAAASSTVTWTSTTPMTCTSCHGNPPTTSGHTSNGVTSSSDCGTCHPDFTGHAVNAGDARHANGLVEGGCTTCHGNKDRTDGGVPGVTYDANEAAAPPVASTAYTPATVIGAHLAHVNPVPPVAGATPTGGVYKPIACTECHPDNTAAPHDGVLTVTFANATGANLPPITATTPTPGNGTTTATTCNTYCHNGASDAPAAPTSWTGAVATCGSCHGFPPTSHAVAADATTCSGCHGETINADGTIIIAGGKHIDGTVQSTGCTGCHGDKNRTDGGMAGVTYDANQAAAPPVASTAYTPATVIGAHLAHVNPTPSTVGSAQPTGGVYPPIACTECHPDNTTGAHPNSVLTVTFANATAANLSPITATTPTPGNGTTTVTTCSTYCHNGASDAPAAPTSWTGAAATCASCHGFPPTSHDAMTTAAECNACHAATVKTDGTIDVAGKKHIDGSVQAVVTEPANGGVNCSACHSDIFAAMSATTTGTRHGLGSVSFVDSGIVWGDKLDNALKGSRSCVNMCHGDHPHDLTSPVTAAHDNNVYADATSSTSRANGSADRIGVGGTGTVNRNRTDFLATATNGGLCVSCHQFGISAAGATAPHVDKAAYDVSAHDFTTFTAGTTWTWQFTLDSGAFDRNCTKCHASATEGMTPTVRAADAGTSSVHFNPNPTLLAGVTRPGTAGPNGLVCFNCHGSAVAANGSQGNRSGVDLQTPFAKAFDHPIASDTVHDTGAERTATYNDGKFKLANRHVNCLDCHDPHEAGATLHAPGVGAIAATSPLRGATGVSFTSPAANFAATVTGNFTFTTTAAFEYELCFKCHSSFAFGTSPPTGLATPAGNLTPSGLAETDVAQEFSTRNQSYHPVVGALPATDPGADGSSRLNSTQLVGTDHTWTPGSLMTCTDCHNADAASPGAQGPHGSAIRFMLAGTNRAWPYTVAGATSGTLFRVDTSETNLNNVNGNGLFCRNCHPDTSAAGTNNFHTDGDVQGGEHGGASVTNCVRCHIRIPHGGKVSRLIVTTAAPARYKVTGQTPNFDNFRKAATYNGYGTIDAYFDSSCSEHSATLTSPEAW